MPAKTKIEWADYISNPIKARSYPVGMDNEKRGHACVKVSEGCAHCWASGFNTRLGTGLEYTAPNMKLVDIYLDESELKKMITFVPRLPKSGVWKNGRSRAVVFPCDMTDLFGDWVPDEWIDRIFFAMHMTPHVDWFLLTKRTDRMMHYLGRKLFGSEKPSKNIYIGSTIENQKRANKRNADMNIISKMGWKTWVSFEPALEVVNWDGWQFLKGLVCGGESGPLARPMPVEAAREARNFCASHDISYFFKQWGEWIPLDHLAWINDDTAFKHKPVEVGGSTMLRIGRARSGNVLDGERHLRMAE